MRNGSAQRVAVSGLLTSLMLVLGLIERQFPLTAAIPGIKLGLANSVLIYALYMLGVKQSIVLMLLKAMMSWLIYTNMQAMFYSLAGGVLSLLAMIIALVFGISMGILAAVNKNSWVDHGANFVAISGISIPHFWLGILLILVFSVNLQWLPASGYVPFSEDPLQNLRTLLLPASVLGTGLAATLMRHTRASMIAVLKADYIRTARAKGLLPKAVILKHAFRNALVPVITLTTLLFGELLGGAVLTEQVFTIPGFGKMIVDSVFNRDYAVVQGVVLIVAIGFLMLNLLADVLYVLINPKMRG